jgi:hypothetical protein
MLKSVQRELDDFFQKLNGDEFQLRSITKGALTQARAQLKYQAFIELDQPTQDEFYENGGAYGWDKYRVLAVDGSTIKLPFHSSIVEEFGVNSFGPNADSPQSMARISLLYDPLNCITVDAQIGGYSTSEASLCYEHLSKVKEDDLLVFDRYYASGNLMWSIKNKNADFLFRMKDNWWNVVDEFQKEKAKDKIIILETDYGSIKVRLIKSGNRVFCTSVLNKKIKPSDFNDLYDNRWGVEEAYKTLKNWCEIETFSGKTALAIKQDFYSKIFLMNLSAAFTHPVEEQIKKEKENYKVNRVQALASISQLPIALFLKKTGSKAIKAFDNIVSKTIDIIRKGRRNPRKIRPKKKHSMSYKKI